MNSHLDDDPPGSDEEDILLYAEFGEFLDLDILQDPNIKFKIIGLDSDEPVLQIQDKYFKGAYSEAPGTNIIFEEDPKPLPCITPLQRKLPEKMLKYVAKTEKVLSMKRLFLHEKDCETTEDTKIADEIATSYEAALEKLSEIKQIKESMLEEIEESFDVSKIKLELQEQNNVTDINEESNER